MMGGYILKRIFYMVPTLLGILTVNFFVIQLAPGGPVEQVISKMQGDRRSVLERITGQDGDLVSTPDTSLNRVNRYKGASGVSPEMIREIEKQFGFDKPVHERYLNMLKSYLCFDFGESFFRDRKVVDIIFEKMPVSISLGLWSTLLIYGISIPLGIRKAVNHGTRFDVWSSTVVILMNSIPVFLFAVLLITVFAGGSYLQWFPLRGLVSPGFDALPFWGKVTDYLHHLCLPILAMSIGGIAGLALLTKNSFLEEINKLYVVTARAKGVTEKRILLGHVFRNAMIIVISGLPATFVSIFFTGSMMIEVIFSLDGMGLLGFESTMQRDYPVMFANLYIGLLMGLVLKIISDITYVWVDPRISFDESEV